MEDRVFAFMVYNGELIAGVGSTVGIIYAYWARWGPTCPRGDMNCNAAINVADVESFVDALLQPETQTNCGQYLANMNGDVSLDGTPKLDGQDITPFVNCVLNGCP